MRRYAFLATFVFLVGLLALDASLLLRPEKLSGVLTQLIEENVRLPVEYASIEPISPTAIRISGITMRRGQMTPDLLFECKSVTVHLGLAGMIRGKPQVERIEIDGPSLHLKWNEAGELRFPSILKADKPFSGELNIPPIGIRDMNVVIEDAPFFKTDYVGHVSGIALDLAPTRSRDFPYRVSGGIDDPRYGAFSIQGEFGEARMRGKVKRPEFRLETALLAGFHDDLRAALKDLRQEGLFDLQLDLSARDLKESISWAARIEAHGVGLQYGEWPGHVTDLDGVVVLDDRSQLNLEGNLFFQLDGANVEVNDLKLDLSEDGLPGRCTGSLRGLLLGERFNANLGDYPEPFPEVSDVLRAISAEGEIDAEFRLAWPDKHERVGVDITVHFNGADLAYRGFDEDGADGYPYPLKDVTGTVHISNDSLRFSDIRPKARDQDLVAGGTVWYGQNPFGYDIHIQGHDLRLDQTLHDALPPDDQVVFDAYRPSGPFDLDLQILLPQGDPGRPDVKVVADLKGCRAVPELIPLELEDIRGQLIFGGDKGTRIKGLIAKRGDARIHVSGLVDMETVLTGGGYDLDVRAVALEVDEDLCRALDREFPDVSSKIRAFGLRGPINLQGHVSATDESEPDTFGIDMLGLSLRHVDRPWLEFTDLRGHIAIANDVMNVARATAQCCGNMLALDGWIDLSGDGYHQITVKAEDFGLNAEALQSAAKLSPFVADLTDIADVSGTLGLRLEFRENENGVLQRAFLNMKGLSVRGRDVPFFAEDIWGGLEVDGDVLTFKAWTASSPLGAGAKASLSVRQAVFDGHRSSPRLTVDGLQVENLQLAEPFFAQLPPDLARGFREAGFRGRLDINVVNLFWKEGRVILKGELKPTSVLKEDGLRLGMLGGVVRLSKLVWDDRGLQVEGAVRNASLALHDFEFEDFNAKLTLTPEALRVTRIQALLLGGRVNKEESNFRLDISTDDWAFDTALSISTLDLSRLVEELGGNPRKLDGRASGLVRLKGRVDDLASWVGGASFELVGRRLYELPFFAVALSIINFDFLTMGDKAVQKGNVRAKIRDMAVHIDKATFRGPGVELDGDGVIGFDGICKLDFRPSLIKWIDGIPLIGQLFSLGSGMIVSVIHVRGPIEQLDASVGNYITEILSSDNDSGRRMKLKPLKGSEKGKHQ